jgi:xanthine dehydrogenase YagS FAD-binding subunit
MNRFEHRDATSVDEVVTLLGDEETRLIAGGTNILPFMKLGVLNPRRLINIKTVPKLGEISFSEENGLVIGAMATIDSIARNKVVRDRYHVLHQAANTIASPQIRNVATIGGNLHQQPRCWYYRGSQNCWLKGGWMCFAAAGENEHHAIFETGPCNSVQPSDIAPALIALGAKARIISLDGERLVDVEELFHSPTDGSRSLTAFPGKLLTRIEVPTPRKGGVGVYVKMMNRRVWTFASVSVAAQMVVENGVVADVRLVLGGVASIPWRLSRGELALRGKTLDPVSMEEIAEMSIAGARPLKNNAYKVPLSRETVREALSKLQASDTNAVRMSTP